MTKTPTNLDLSQLDGLPREQQELILTLLREKKRRDQEARDAYKPNSGQMPMHESKADIRLCLSGNGSGKTVAAIHEALWRCEGRNPITKERFKVPADVAVVLDKPNKADTVWIPEMKRWFDTERWTFSKAGKPSTSVIKFPNGSTLTFYSHEQDELTFESIQIDMAVFDEPPPRHVYVGLRRGGRKKGSKPRFLIIGTPLAAPWLRTEIYEPWAKGERPDIDCFRMSTDVNKDNLEWSAMESYFKDLTEKEARIRREGEFFDLEGLALSKSFSRETHVIDPFEWNPSWPCVLAMDPHPHKPHHAILMGIDESDQLYVINELAARTQNAEKFAELLKPWYNSYRIVDTVCDNYGSGEMTAGDGRLSFIQSLRDNGIPVRPTSYDEKSDERFVEKIREVLKPVENNYGEKVPLLRVFDSCRGSITDFENVCWQKHRNMDVYKPKLELGNRDFLVCIKYALATNPHFTKGRTKVVRRRKLPPTYGYKKPRRFY